MVPKHIINSVKKFAEAVREADLKVDQVYIFGSYTKGLAGKWSDIDVAVIMPAFKGDKFDQTVELRKIALQVDYRIEPVAFETKSFAEDNWIPLVYEIKNHGIPIEVAA